MDAYATLKSLPKSDGSQATQLVVNRADSATASDVHARLERSSQRFLDTSIKLAGHVTDDETADESVTAPEVSEREPGPLRESLAAQDLHIHARYVRVRALSMKTVPQWHDAAGLGAWLFVDEIMVNSGATPPDGMH